MEEDLQLEDIEQILSSPEVNVATVGRIFELLVKDFLEEFESLEGFLSAGEHQHTHCLTQLYELEQDHQETDRNFSLAVHLFSRYIKAYLVNDNEFAQDLTKLLYEKANLANSATLNQLLGALL